ncbi:polyadenylate-binding protein-interacting protein 1 isoform 1-T1 [Polymixia lowei]
MNENFDRAPGAGRVRVQPTCPGLSGAGDGDAKTSLFNQREPLRQPRTSPPLSENNISTSNDIAGADARRQNKPQQSAYDNSTAAALVKSSKLSANAAVFVPFGGNTDEDPAFYYDSESYYEPTLAELVADILGHLSSSPGSFESDIEEITDTLNYWVTTEETLQELVELIYTQSTAIPNFSYTGARLCNHLSHNLAISPASGNFRQRLLQRCQKEYEQRAVAVQGDKETQKSFHSFVLFLGEVYLNLEVKSGKGTPNRANILLAALKELLNSLFSNPVDANLICAVKLLKLTGSVLEDAWKESGKSDMEELIHRIEAVVLDASCSRDVKQMLLKLVELRSSDWGRVHGAAAASNATPDNDPNYFMNEPTFYTADGTPFTAADPEYSEKYQEILDREEYFPELYEENGDDSFYFEDEMDPEIEEAFENFCLESERKRQQ